MHPFSWSKRIGSLSLAVGIALQALPAFAQPDPAPECAGDSLQTAIPYLWTRNPDGREAEAMHSAVQDELQRSLLGQLDLDNWDDARERLRISSASLVGYSSPESMKGADTIRPENVDPVNVRVGENRARTLSQAVLAALAELGLQESTISVSGDERQFARDEWEALHQIATGSESIGIIDVPEIYRLLIRLKQRPDSFEKAQLAALQQLLTDKKQVSISLCYELSAKPESESTKPLASTGPATRPDEWPDEGPEPISDPVVTSADRPADVPAGPAAETASPNQPVAAERPPLERTPLKRHPQTTASADDLIGQLLAGDYETVANRILDHLWWILLAISILAAAVWALIRATDALAESTPRPHTARSHRRRSWSASGPRMMAIMSGKGGTGKSSISSSLAYGLAHLGYKTLLVDVDLFTHGLTVLNQPSLGEVPNCVPLKNAFDPVEEGQTAARPTPVRVETRFTGDNLFVLPSIPISDVDLDAMPVAAFEPLELPAPHNETKPFAEQLQVTLQSICDEHRFDYVILDTRGGADHTSVGAALAATAFILVTEADKPSWAISDRLLDTVYAVRKEVDMKTRPIGFVINKNALPAGEIEEHLKERWEMKHLGTLPYDPVVVRCFEKARIPLEAEGNADFSEGVFALLRRLDHARIWD